jgi:hypothetical protein
MLFNKEPIDTTFMLTEGFRVNSGYDEDDFGQILFNGQVIFTGTRSNLEQLLMLLKSLCL